MSVKENEMAKKADTKVITEEEIDQVLDETAADSLKPNSHPSEGPESKVTKMASVVGALGAMPIDWWGDHAKDILTQYEKWKTNAAKGSADSNKATLKTKPSDAKGDSGPAADASMKQVDGQYKPALWTATKEEVESIFGGESLTEDAQAKISTLFEAAVNLKVSLIEADLEEHFNVLLDEEMEEFINETKQNLDTYLDYAVDQWMTENEVAVVDTLRLENAEEFMEKLKDLFVESYIDVPEERLDVVREMSEKVVDLESQLDELLREKEELEEDALKFKQDEIVKSVSEGLTLSDSEKLKTLIEDVTFENPESYAKKLGVIKEQYFTKAPPKTDKASPEMISEEIATGDGFTKIAGGPKDPFVAASLKALQRLG